MSESGANEVSSASSSSTSSKRGFWRRLFRWCLLGGGIFFGVFLVFLVKITLPDLRREVAPPEISGPEQIARVDNTRENPQLGDAPTSKTAALDQSGRVILDLDDFPHLSPTMRREAETWVRTWNTRIVPDILAIEDPDLRKQKWDLTSEYIEILRSHLNLPVEWETLSNATAYEKTEACSSYWHNKPLLAHPGFSALQERLRFERAVYYEDWAEAVGFRDTGVWAKRVASNGMQYSSDFDWRDLGNAGVETGVSRPTDRDFWNERVYCWRQMGFVGQLGLVANSYERSLRTQMRNAKAVYVLSLPSGFVWEVSHNVWKVWGKPPKNFASPEPPMPE